MAAGPILSVLSNIPWKTVIENAPKLAEGTARLWNTVSRWRKSDPVQNAALDVSADAFISSDDALQQRLRTLEDSVRHLNEQMQASTELLKSLAEQNIKLVERAELNRRRVARLVRLCIALSIGLAAVIVYLLILR